MRNILVASLTLMALAAVGSGEDWPQFWGPNRDGITSETNLMHAFPPEGPKVLWTVKLGQGYGGPSIQGGKVYVLDRVADKEEVLRCLDLQTGKEEWTCGYEAPGKVDHNGSRSSPTVDDKYVFTVGVFGRLTCFSKDTHKIIWSKELLKDYGGKLPAWAVAQSPAMYKDSVIVAPQSPSVGLVAYEKGTGKELWKSKPIGKMDYSSPRIVKLLGADQVIMMNGQRVVGANPDTGEILWQYDGLPVNVASVPCPTPIGDGRFFVSGGYNAGCAMFKVEKTGEKFTVTQVFKNGSVNAHIHNAILYKDYLYVLGNTNNSRDGLVCLDLEGNVKWKTGKGTFDKGNYVLADGVLYIMDGASGVLKILDPTPEGYKELSQTKVLEGKEIWGPMALSDGKLVCRDQGQMKCLDIKAK
jgi:outer membrane protein assembly factor BamB